MQANGGTSERTSKVNQELRKEKKKEKLQKELDRKEKRLQKRQHYWYLEKRPMRYGERTTRKTN
ncbi:transposase (fragment) [Petrocella atlantisensis]|uniref:Transposase n=1 Tax=Petrocella atlantisensis TaxID=2173034 RepID=A0A3P7RV44_9FIRM